MNKRSAFAVWGPVLVAMLVVAVVFATGILDRQRVFEDMVYNNMHFEDGRYAFSLEQGDAYGLVNDGETGLNLPEGTYRLRWEIEGDGDNLLHISCDNGALITPSEVILPAGQGRGEVELTVKEACVGLNLGVEFASGTYVNVVNLRMYSPFYNDDAWTLLFFAVGLSILWVLCVTGRLEGEQLGVLIFVALAVLIANGPAYKETLNIAHDTNFHMARIENLVSGLRSGQFPVRAGGHTYNGYGAITSVFYADVFLYPLAIMRILGASIQYVMNAYMVAVSIVSAATMYFCAKRMFGGRWAAACAAILYTLAVYRATNAYTRCAVGEVTAMAILPLFMLGLWEVVLGDRSYDVLLGVSAACIFLCHMISTLICALTAVVFCLLFVRRIFRERRLVSLFKALGIALLLCAFQIVPLIMYSMQGIGAEAILIDVAYFALEPAQLFSLGSGNTVVPRDPRLTRFATEIGLPQMVAAALALYVIATQKKRGSQERAAGLLVLAGVCFSVMSTMLFPWSYVEVLTGGLSNYIQFSWRFLMMTTVCFALAGGYGLTRFAGTRPDVAAALALCVAALCTMPTLSRETRYDEYYAYGQSGDTGVTYPEYMIPGSDAQRTTERTVLAEGDVAFEGYDKQGTTITGDVSAQTDAALTFPLFGFDGYEAEANGQRMEVELGDNNRLKVLLPEGTQGEMKVWFAGKGYWRIADAISAVTLVALVVRGWLRRRKRISGSAGVANRG